MEIRTPGNSAGIEPRVWVGRLRNWSLIAGKDKRFYFSFHSIQTNSGAHLLVYAVITGVYFPKVKVAMVKVSRLKAIRLHGVMLN
jgi:hypothetical protein